MSDEQCQVPTPKYGYPDGTAAPVDEGFDHKGWVLLVFIASLAIGVIVGWWRDDWELGAALAGSNYIVGLLAIIALKD